MPVACLKRQEVSFDKRRPTEKKQSYFLIQWDDRYPKLTLSRVWILFVNELENHQDRFKATATNTFGTTWLSMHN